MKKAMLVFILLIGLLTGCAAEETARFVVSDEIVSLPAGCTRYGISVCLPEGMTEAVSAQSDARRLFESADGSYYVVTEVCPNCTAEEVIRQMTGSDAGTLGALCTQNMSMPEYRFSWCMEGENGMLTCTGIVVEDTAYCYSLQFCVREDAAKACAQAREQVMSSFGLYGDEGF